MTQNNTFTHLPDSLSSVFPDSTSDILPFNMTNDYMFRAVLQECPEALKGLVCALLHLNPEEVTSIEIKNPIQLGQAITSKTFILDILVLLNDNRYINLEMQVRDNRNWPERSLSYLCRTFDQLPTGEDYVFLKPVIHIAFLDYTLFPDSPEFYATYQLKNIKSNALYSDKFTLSVIDLNHTELAEPEDISSGLVQWIQFFKATTWKEVLHMAAQNPDISNAASTMHSMYQNNYVYDECWQREEENRVRRSLVLEGEREGERRGESKGEDHFAALAQKLIADNLLDELTRATSDKAYRQELYKRYNL